MFYLTVQGNWGDCMVDWDNEPTWCLDNAMTFDTEADANAWIEDHGHEWVGVDGEKDKILVEYID